VQRMIELATQYGRYGYHRITAMLRREGWRVNHKRIERLWRREGLKVPAKQPKRRHTTNRRAVCGKPARTGRRAEGLNSISPYYPDRDFLQRAERECRHPRIV
jgi:transposase InsO family protein